MTKNLGGLDRAVRIAASGGLIASSAFAPLADSARFGLGAVGLVALITAIAGFCPAYKLFGLSSAEDKHTPNAPT